MNLAWPGMARQGEAWLGVARHGVAGRGMAWPGEAGQGEAGQGEARRGEANYIPRSVSSGEQLLDIMDNENGELRKLPLWKSCVEEMIRDGVKYGDTYTAEFFEERLRCKRGTLEFGCAVTKIRKVLETHGMYLNGRGHNGNQYVIISADSNFDQGSAFNRKVKRATDRGLTLLANTPLEMVSPSKRARHERLENIFAIRKILNNRTTSVEKVIRKYAPKILNEPQEKDT